MDTFNMNKEFRETETESFERRLRGIRKQPPTHIEKVNIRCLELYRKIEISGITEEMQDTIIEEFLLELWTCSQPENDMYVDNGKDREATLHLLKGVLMDEEIIDLGFK